MPRPSLGESPVRKLTCTVAKETYASYRYFNRLVVHVTDQPANTKCWRKTSGMEKKSIKIKKKEKKKKKKQYILTQSVFSYLELKLNNLI